MKPRHVLVVGLSLAATVLLGALTWWVTVEDPALRSLRTRMEHPRIILVTFDTLNVWYTSLFSENGAPTPNLEALAADGVLFERVYTSVPITLPSHTTLLSSRLPWSTGVLANGDRVPEEVITLPEILSANGYRTAAFLSLGVLNPNFNLDQGFDEYDSVPNRKLGRWYRTADEVFEPAARWIEANSREPFFLWLHLSDPHEPYLAVGAPPDVEARLDGSVIGRWNLGSKERQRIHFDLPPGIHSLVWTALAAPGDGAPVPVLEISGDFELRRWAQTELEEGPVVRRLEPSWRVELLNDGPEAVEVVITFQGTLAEQEPRWIRARYREEVTYADHYLGELRRLFEDRGLAEHSLWIVASDHGEGLFHHGILGHGAYTREEQLRTLLMFSGPGVPRRVRLESPPVRLEDTLPTLLDLLGLPAPEDAEGTSLVRCWSVAGCAGSRREWISFGVSDLRSLRSVSLYRWPLKALWSKHHARPGVFDLATDPREQEPLAFLPRSSDALAEVAIALDPPLDGMVERLDRHVTALRAILARSDTNELDAEQRKMLESLGYL